MLLSAHDLGLMYSSHIWVRNQICKTNKRKALDTAQLKKIKKETTKEKATESKKQRKKVYSLLLIPIPSNLDQLLPQLLQSEGDR